MKKNVKKLALESLKALSDDTRLNIVLLLASGNKCVCEIFGHLKLPQNLVSHHLGILREGGIINSEKKGKWVYYSLNDKVINDLGKFINELAKFKQRKTDY